MGYNYPQETTLLRSHQSHQLCQCHSWSTSCYLLQWLLPSSPFFQLCGLGISCVRNFFLAKFPNFNPITAIHQDANQTQTRHFPSPGFSGRFWHRDVPRYWGAENCPQRLMGFGHPKMVIFVSTAPKGWPEMVWIFAGHPQFYFENIPKASKMLNLLLSSQLQNLICWAILEETCSQKWDLTKNKNKKLGQLLPSDPLITQLEITEPLKRSLKTPQKGHFLKNLGEGFVWLKRYPQKPQWFLFDNAPVGNRSKNPKVGIRWHWARLKMRQAFWTPPDHLQSGTIIYKNKQKQDKVLTSSYQRLAASTVTAS